MKMKSCVVAFVACLFTALAPSAQETTAVVERGPHHKIYETVQSKTVGSRVLKRSHRVVALETGMHRWSEEANQWVEADTRIELFQDGAVARNTAFQVIFPANLNSEGVDILLPDGQRLLASPLGLAYRHNDQSILIAELQDCAALVQDNTIIYEDALPGCHVRFIVRKGSLEQDLLIHRQLNLPEEFGLPANSVLQLITELLPSAPPVRQARIIREGKAAQGADPGEPSLVNERISLGSMEFLNGRAFSTGQDPLDTGIPTMKTWQVWDGRNFLVEEIDWPNLKPHLADLPAASGLAKGQSKPQKHQVTPAARMAKAIIRPVEMASRGLTVPKGVVWDYTLASSASNYTFCSDTVYLVQGNVSLSGTTTFEGGTVVKFAKNAGAQLRLTGPSSWKTDFYSPVILTAADDSTLGESISTNSLSGFYADPALYFDSAFTNDIRHIRISHALRGIYFDYDSGSMQKLSHAQFVHCGTAITPLNTTLYMRNVLFDDMQTNFAAPYYTSAVRGEHITFHRTGCFSPTNAISVYLTNSLLAAVTNLAVPYWGWVGYVTESSVCVSNAGYSANVFAPTGAGTAYLATNSVYRDQGTTNIDATLRRDLARCTTYAPVVLQGLTNPAITLSPAVSRDTDTPDLGAHYPALDYAISGILLSNANLTISGGAKIATFGAEGFLLKENSQLQSYGSATSPATWVRYYTVQEQTTNWGGAAPPNHQFVRVATTSASPTIFAEFSQFFLHAGDGYHFFGLAPEEKIGTITLRHSELHGGFFDLYNYDSSSDCAFTNNLFERVTCAFEGAGNRFFFNNLFWSSTSSFYRYGGPQWSACDNSFHAGQLFDSGYAINNHHNGYIALSGRLQSGYSDVELASLNYSIGQFGRYYQPTNQYQINGGSRNSTNAALFHFTVNQAMETNSIVDIGYHYVATDSNGVPPDADGDALADYIEDASGDGVFTPNAVETDLNTYSTLTGTHPQLNVFTPLK